MISWREPAKYQTFLNLNVSDKGHSFDLRDVSYTIRDVPCIFWLKDPNDPSSASVVYRFKRVLFGVTSSPFILNATLDKHLMPLDDPVEKHIPKHNQLRQ